MYYVPQDTRSKSWGDKWKNILFNGNGRRFSTYRYIYWMYDFMKTKT